MISINLVVLRASEPDRLAWFYGSLGMRFHKERHGSGPEHHACDVGGSVFEIYPLQQGAGGTRDTRLGFVVESLSDAVQAAVSADGILLSPPKMTSWGRRAVVQDPEGHKVELTEAA